MFGGATATCLLLLLNGCGIATSPLCTNHSSRRVSTNSVLEGLVGQISLFLFLSYSLLSEIALVSYSGGVEVVTIYIKRKLSCDVSTPLTTINLIEFFYFIIII